MSQMAPYRKWYQVNEIFTSVQGEGALVGLPSTFIRLQGCSVGCPWCDTKYTWHNGGTKMDVEDIVAQVTSNHVVITGGEPTVWNLDGLIEAINMKNRLTTTQLETSGQNELKGELVPNYVTWSPKANLNFQAPDELKRKVNEIKFVVDADFDVERDAIPVIRSFDKLLYPTRLAHIILMPEGCPPTPASAQKTLDAVHWLSYKNPFPGVDVRYGDRIQYRIGVR